MQDLFIPNGSEVKNGRVNFKLFLPDVSPIRIMAKAWPFNSNSDRVEIVLKNNEINMWTGSFEPKASGLYEYAYDVEYNDGSEYISSDPCAKLSSPRGEFSAFCVGESVKEGYAWQNDLRFNRPEDRELRVYELMLQDFTAEWQKTGLSPISLATEMLDHIANSGFNAIEFMPWIACPGSGYNWGYNPFHYFAVDPRLGTVGELKALIDRCHELGIVVIMDIALNHVDKVWGYLALYGSDKKLSPFIGDFHETFLGMPDLDYENFYTQRLAFEVCKWWLDEFHIDGFRFDFTAGFYSDKNDAGIKKLISDIYDYGREKFSSLPTLKTLPYMWLEYIGSKPTLEVLNDTAASACWYDDFRYSMHNMAQFKLLDGSIQQKLDPKCAGLQEESHGVKKTVISQLENHDHHFFSIKLRCMENEKDQYGYPVGDRSIILWSKPFIIALYTGCGIPMIRNGQEFAENWFLPESGWGRLLPRPIRWEYAEDQTGKLLSAFYAKMNKIRAKYLSLSTLNYYHYFTDTEKQIVAYHRFNDNEKIVVVINFSFRGNLADVPFPQNGKWVDVLSGMKIEVSNWQKQVSVPSMDGYIFVLQ